MIHEGGYRKPCGHLISEWCSCIVIRDDTTGTWDYPTVWRLSCTTTTTPILQARKEPERKEVNTARTGPVAMSKSRMKMERKKHWRKISREPQRWRGMRA